LVGSWTAVAAYAFQYWAGVESDLPLVDVAARSAAVRRERDVAFEGLLFGFRYSF
jgi:hypothetical protein